MSPRSHDRLIDGARTLARLAALLVALIGAATLAGRLTGVAGLSRLAPDAPRMSANAALAFLLFGVALRVHAAPAPRPVVAAVARAAGWAATLLGVVVGLEWLAGADLGVDQLLVAAAEGGAHPGRMCPTVCGALVALGGALELDRRRHIDGRLVNVVALAPLVLGLLAVSGYVTGVTAFTELGGALRISPAAAIALVAAGWALLLARPQRGSIRLLVSDGPGGIIARRLLPVGVILPLALDAARLELDRAHLVDRATGDWLYAFTLAALSAVGLLVLVRRLDGLDAVRRAADDRLRESEARLAGVVAAQSAIAAGAGELVATLELVAEEARDIVGAAGAVVELPDGDDMVYRAAVGAGAPFRGTRVPQAGSLSGAVLAGGESASCADTDVDPRVDRDACRRVGARSMICVALRHHGESVGVLKVFSGEPGAFAGRDVRTLELLAGLAAATVHRAQAEQRLAALHAAGAELAGARSLEGGLAGALRGLGEQLGWGLGTVWLAGSDGALACAETWHHAGVPAGPYLELCSDPEPPGAGTLLDTVRRSGARAWVEHPEADPGGSPDPRRMRAATACGLQTLIAVPIVSRRETLGVLELACSHPRSHDAETLDLVADVATQIGQFVQRRRAEERMAAQAANLAAVAELSQALAQNPDPAATRPTLVDAVRTLARADSVILFEPDGDDHLAVTAESGGLVAPGTRLHVRDDQAITLDVFRTGRGRFVADYTAEPVHARAIQQRTALRSAHYEPIRRDGKVAAVLVVASRDVRSKDAGGIDALMRLLAGEAGTALALSDLVATLDARARTDQLTGLANRRTWDHELPRELARARRTGEPLSLAILDLDRFKAYNDTHGHPAGDRLLRGAAAAWTERLRSTDVLARYGGEEFAVLLPGCDAHSAAQVAEALRAAVPDEETCSIGVVTWDGLEPADALVARADAALYRAKDTGRDRVVAA
jgi:diguanylate cyclase (GGDEF)-like protein